MFASFQLQFQHLVFGDFFAKRGARFDLSQVVIANLVEYDFIVDAIKEARLML